MAKANEPSTIPFNVSELPEVAAKPLAAVKVMPRLASNAAAPVACKTPPLNVIELAVVVDGTVPMFRSVAIDNIPAEMVVVPV